MQNYENITVGEITQSLRVVFWIFSGMSGGITFIFGFAFKLLYNHIRKFNDLRSKVNDLERDISDLKDRDVGRSAFTKALYGLSDRTTGQGVEIKEIKEDNAEIKDTVKSLFDRCDRRHNG